MAAVPTNDALLSQEQLTEAFHAFSSAAGALERSYFGLGQEVDRLRRELQMERDLRHRRDALAEVSAVLAHEIRNPLGSLELFSGLLAESELATKQRQWVQHLQHAITIISATVSNILQFHSGVQTVLERTELNTILRSLQALLVPGAAQAGLKWELDWCEQELWVAGDRQRLEQVFLNLTLNAFRFAAKGGVVGLSTRREDGDALVTVADHGPGISPEILPRIFQPGATTRSGGTGLGLAVVKRIVEWHHGVIGVSSVPGRGSTFTVRLPLAEPRAAAAFKAEQGLAAAAGGAA